MAEDIASQADSPPHTDPQSHRLSERFARFSTHAATLTGNYKTFIVMLGVVLVWAVTGPLFQFSTAWQLVINTGTTIITFLMVFLIQNTQNRDSLALHLKLDEIINAIDKADDELIRAEDESEEELTELKQRYHEIMLAHRELLKAAAPEQLGSDTAAAAAPEPPPASE